MKNVLLLAYMDESEKKTYSDFFIMGNVVNIHYKKT